MGRGRVITSGPKNEWIDNFTQYFLKDLSINVVMHVISEDYVRDFEV